MNNPYTTPCPNHFRERMVLERLLKLLKTGNAPNATFIAELPEQLENLCGCKIHHYGKRDIFITGKHNTLVGMVHSILKALPALPDPDAIRALEEEIKALAIREVQHDRIDDSHSQSRLPGF